jgi:nitrite reductase (NADH) large subunit
MPRQIDEAGSEVLAHKLSQLDIKIHTGKNTKLIDGNGKLEGLVFADETRLDVEMLVISAGIRPRDELAKANGLNVHPRGGIMVDNFLRTNDENIFAIGEAVVHNNMVYGLVAPGYEMAEVVVRQLNGDNSREFLGFDMSTKLKLIGVDVGSFGDPFAEDSGIIPIVFKDKRKGIYKRINITEDGKHIVGGVLIGDASQYNMLHQMVTNKMKLPENPETLIGIGGGGNVDEAAGVKGLPDTAQICSCENVSKGDITMQVTECGATNINDYRCLHCRLC